MMWRWALSALSLLAVSTASAQTAKEPPLREPPTWRQLERFSSEAEFLSYIRDVQGLSMRDRREQYAPFGAVPAPPPPPSPPPPPPPPGAPAPSAAPSPQASSAASDIVVTASGPADTGSASEPSSITNVQTQGVDEGGIVKQVGRFLIVLQDGRLFVVDTRPGGEAGLALIGRTNVYRTANADTWFDELLVSGNRVLVTGYSYREGASEVTVFTIDESGALTREATYYLSSNDYYDVENYSTRLVNGALVIYTPLDLSNVNINERMRWPLVRRWVRDGERQAVTTTGRALFDAQDIYKPVQPTYAPMVHSVSVCPLGDLRSGDELDCRTTAFVGQRQREFFVSTTDIFLWVTPNWSDRVFEGNCERSRETSVPATIFQVPLNGQSPRAVHARGVPPSQLALDGDATEMRALLSWNTHPCANSASPQVRYFHIPLSAFSTTPRPANASRYVAAPPPGGEQYEVRFTGTHVVYGARSSYSSFPPEERTTPLSSRVVALPLARPRAASVIDTPHSVLRVERAGRNAVVTGYRTDAGLSVSLIDLSAQPRIATTTLLRNRYESENRSHAFNALVRPEGDGLIGLPTVTRVKESGRWYFRSQASDVSFITVDRTGALGAAGELLAGQNAQHPSYRCEVSCVDWYGNTRALFIGSRVFALSATELIEGDLVDGRIGERRRLNLSAPPPRS